MTDREEAIGFLRSIMDDDTARKADRIKAAEAILRADSATPSAPGALHDLDDGELLARARGETEGGSPPREGPKAPGVAAVPSNERDEHSLHAPSNPLAAPDHHVPRETSPLLARGPKEDPPIRASRVPLTAEQKAQRNRDKVKRYRERQKGTPISTPTAEGTRNGPADYIDPLS
jgi:hypothetical protein